MMILGWTSVGAAHVAKHVAILGAPSPAPAPALAPAPACPLAYPCHCSLSLFLFLALQPQARATALTWFWSRSSSYLSRLPVSYLPALVLMSGAWATCPPSPGSSFFFSQTHPHVYEIGKGGPADSFPGTQLYLYYLYQYLKVYSDQVPDDVCVAQTSFAGSFTLTVGHFLSTGAPRTARHSN